MEYIAHFGIKHRSGRYPWGSGKDPYQGDPQHKAIKATKIATALGGPAAGVVAGLVALKKSQNKSSQSSKTTSSKRQYTEEELNTIKNAAKKGGLVGGTIALAKVNKSQSTNKDNVSSSTDQKSNFKQFKAEQKSSKSGLSSLEKEFFNKNKDLIDRMNASIKKESKWYDADNRASEMSIDYGEKSKQYKNANNTAEQLYKNYAEYQNKLSKDFETRGRAFIKEKLGSYANKKISGMNVPGGAKNAADLFLRNASNYWWKMNK